MLNFIKHYFAFFEGRWGGGCISLLKGRYDYQYDFLISDYPFISGILVAFLNQNPLFFPPEETLILDICKKL